MRRWGSLFFGAACWQIACSGGPGPSSAPPQQPSTWSVSSEPLGLKSVDWNAGHADLGNVSASTESADEVAVFSDQGAIVVTGGAITATDSSVVAWRSSSLLPAADANGSWPTAVDASGHIFRLRAHTTLEDISDRYGLAMDSVQAALPLGGPFVAFVLDASIAVADGSQVVRYDVAAPAGSSGGARKVAGIGPDGEIVAFDLVTSTVTTLALSGATATAIDVQGRTFVETPQEIYELQTNGATLVHRSTTANLHGFVTSVGRIWFGEGSEIGMLDGSKEQLVLTSGAGIPEDASLGPSLAGGVWVLSQGTLSRFKIPVSGDEAVWEATVLPIYAHVCSDCHGPSGTSGVDLSTYADWVTERAKVYNRVYVKRDMPQNRTLADADREAIRAWAASN
jgi:hypothetical protein